MGAEYLVVMNSLPASLEREGGFRFRPKSLAIKVAVLQNGLDPPS